MVKDIRENNAEIHIWKSDWREACKALKDWWECRGPAIHVTAPKDEPWEEVAPPPPSHDLETQWLDPVHRMQRNLYHMSRTYYGGAALPIYDANVGGPGSLGLFLGCEGHLAPDTVWYDPVISDPESYPELVLEPSNRWWNLHVRALKEGLRHSEGRYIMGSPDLIENIDTLAQLRGPESTLMDMIERPEWVERSVLAINRAFFDAFDRLEPFVTSPWGGTAFQAFALWGPGKTAKVQCDFCCMISPEMFRRFVQPALAEQCAKLDYAMYHLDGTQALPQLDNLLSIECLKAIEWTPQAGLPGGGSPEWYDLYRRIKRGGKAVQVVGATCEEVEPLLDAVGPEGVFVMTWAPNETSARKLLERTGWRC